MAFGGWNIDVNLNGVPQKAEAALGYSFTWLKN